MGVRRQRAVWLWRKPDNVSHRQLLSIDQVWRRSTALTWSRWGCRRLADNIWLLAHDNNNNCAYPRRDSQAELVWVAGYVVRQFTYPKAVTHPSTNWARCRATELIKTNALPLHQTASLLTDRPLLPPWIRQWSRCKHRLRVLSNHIYLFARKEYKPNSM